MDPRIKMMPAAPSYWQAVCDQHVRKAEIEAKIEVRKLTEEQKLIEADAGRVVAELGRCGESESGVRAHRTLGHWWGGLFVLATALAVVSAWWTVNWYLTLTWEKAVLAATLCVLPLIGWMAFLMRARDALNPRHVQKILCTLGLLIVLSSLTAGALLGLGRMAGTVVTEERELSAASTPADLDAPSAPPSPERATWAKKLLALTGTGAVILLVIASEVAAGVAFDEYVKRMTVVWTVGPLYRRRDELAELLADNAEAQEAARLRPELLRAQLTIAGLTEEQVARERAAEGARMKDDAARAAKERAHRHDSLGFLVRWVVIAFAIGLVVILAIVAIASASEAPGGATIVLLDLSESTGPREFKANALAVEGVIAWIVQPGERLTILGIRDRSFGTPPIFAETAPRSGGRFGEYMDAWRAKAIREWRAVAGQLRPSAKGTDILGALARASTEFGEVAGAAKRLIILSDMRHVGRGLNLETGHAPPAMSTLEGRGLVARLDGVEVWVLGVHTVGSDIGPWRDLKAFWGEYFLRSSAELKAFSPNRLLSVRR